MVQISERDITPIGERMKIFRESLCLSQEQLAKTLCGTKRGLQDNEWGRAAPNSKVLIGLARLGLNVNWLLLGEGPMLLSQLRLPDYRQLSESGKLSQVDAGGLSLAIAAVEKATDEHNLLIGTEKRADMITLTYQELMRGVPESEATAYLARLIRLISDIAPKKPKPSTEIGQAGTGLTEDEKMIVETFRDGNSKNRDIILSAVQLAKGRQNAGKVA